MFSLRFAHGRLSHFCYEADRGTMPSADMLKKLRAYHHFIKRQQKHKEAFGVHPIRAVLIETTDEPRARRLMELAQNPAVIGARKRSAVFWFTIASVHVPPACIAHSDAPPALRPYTRITHTRVISEAVLGGTIDVSARWLGNRIEVVVRDEGPGIAPEILDSLFRPHVSTKAFGGLGLHIVETIVQQARGEVRAGNRAHRSGAEFIITVPADPLLSRPAHR